MAPDDQPAHSRGRRKNKNQLPAPAQHNGTAPNSRWHFNKSTAAVAEITFKVDSPVETQPGPLPKLEWRQSKLSLFGLFSAPKVERSRGYTEPGLGLDIIQERAPSPQRSIKSSFSRPPSRATTSLGFMPSDDHSEMRKTLASRGSAIQTTTSADGWAPPPLFQAYPQAIKYATLQASTVSAENLERAQGHTRKMSQLQEQFESSIDLTIDVAPAAVGAHKKEKAFLAKKRSSTAPFGGAQLANKVYVLVTSGYLLQYPGEGSSDRKPERVLKLSKDSAAFASNLIPGKHFVLEVRQAMNDQGHEVLVPKQSKSLLGRLRSQGATPVRRQNNTMLLILGSADEMVAWMKAVRRVIDDLSGRGHKPTASVEGKRDSGHDAGDDTRSVISHRYKVQRRNERQESISTASPVNSRTPSRGGPVPSSDVDHEAEPPCNRASSRARLGPSDTTSVRSLKFGSRASIRESVEASSRATSATMLSQDQLRLDQLCEDSRQSFLSNRTSDTGYLTINTSHSSSSGPPSPKEDDKLETFKSPATLKSSYTSPNASNHPRRRTMQALPATTELPNAGLVDAPQPISIQPVSTVQDAEDNSPVDPKLEAPIPSQRRVSSYTPSMPVRERTTLRSQSAMDHHRLSNNRVSTISTASNTSERSSNGPVQDPSQRLSTGRPLSTLGALPNLSNPSLTSLHKLQQAQDAGRIPASTRKRYSRPIPIRVSGPATPSPGSHGTKQPLIPKRLSSLPSPPSNRIINFSPGPSPAQGPQRSPNFSQPRPRSASGLKILSIASPSPAATPSSTQASSSPTAPSPSIGSTKHSTALPHMANQSNPTGKPPQTMGLRRPASMQIRADPAPFLSSSRPQPHSSARMSRSINPATIIRPATAAGLLRSSSLSPASTTSLETVGEMHVMKAMGPSDPWKPTDKDRERLALRSRGSSVNGRVGPMSPPTAMKVRMSMPTITVDKPSFVEGINGIKIPVRSGAASPAPIIEGLPPPPPGAPPNGPLPAVPGLQILPDLPSLPPDRPLPAVPGEMLAPIGSAV